MLGPQGTSLQFLQRSPSEISTQVLSSVGEYRRLAPQGRLKEDDDFSAILKAIVELEDYDHVNSSEPQLQSSGHALYDDVSVDQRSKRGRSSQGVLCIDFVKEEFKRLLASSKARAEAAPHNDYAFDKVGTETGS